ncbi:hypothetical protein ACFXKC_28635 [Streptomyces sp. NPDC059340]|uniref:hypothetical protein n=1 Tax=Streptomyces sp. NPDC059340 TaxID=3346806 RepID=UPI0036C48740
MHRTTTVLLAIAALALAGCSSSGNSPKPTPTVTVTRAPKLSAAAQRAACVDAWADAIDAGASADDTPKACKGLADSAQLDAYMAGLHERNKRAQASFQACTGDPSCTEAP